MQSVMTQRTSYFILGILSIVMIISMACGTSSTAPAIDPPAANTANDQAPAPAATNAEPAPTANESSPAPVQTQAQPLATSAPQQPSQPTGASKQTVAPTVAVEQPTTVVAIEQDRPTLKAGVVWLDSPLDPVNGSWAAIQSGMSETLFRLGADDLSPQPWLATGAEQIDPLTWEVSLRSDVRFHNGSVMDAEAVKGSLERAFGLAPAIEEVLGIDSITVKDDQMLVLTTHEPRPTLPGLLTATTTAIVDAAATDAAGEGNFIEAAPLTGPYIPTEYVLKERLVSVANDEYWGGAPSLAGIEHLAIPDTNSRELALQAGDIDLAMNISPEGAARIDTLPELESRGVGIGTSVVMWWVNFERGTLSDPLVRQAVSHAIDREGIAGLVAPSGTGSFADLLLPEAMASCPGVGGPDYDPQLATELLAQAGYVDTDGDGYVDKDGQALELVIGGYPQRFQLPIMAEAAQAMLGEVGIKVEVLITEWSVVKEPAWDLFGWFSNVIEVGDPVFNVSKFVGLHADASASGNNNYGHYSNPDLVTIISQAGDVSDIQQRKEIACEALAVVAADIAVLPVAHANLVYGVNERVAGFDPHPHRAYFVDHLIGLSE